MTETSKEYASALFELAAEEERLPEVSESLALIHSQFRENPGYADLLASPNIPVSERLAAIDEAFGGAVSEEVISFLKILCRKDRRYPAAAASPVDVELDLSDFSDFFKDLKKKK